MATRVRRPQHTHEVTNQPPPLEGYNPFDADPALREALERHGGGWGIDRVRDFGAVTGSAEAAGALPPRPAQRSRAAHA